jgi:hypothetical protein
MEANMIIGLAIPVALALLLALAVVVARLAILRSHQPKSLRAQLLAEYLRLLTQYAVLGAQQGQYESRVADQNAHLAQQQGLIAERAAKLYDKLVGFVDSFEGVGKALEKAQSTYKEARTKMLSGNHNLLLQGEKMEKWQRRQSAKSLPPDLLLGD